MSSDQDRTADMVYRITSLPATALAGFIEDTTGMIARGEVAPDFADWVDLAIERLDELAINPNSPPSGWPL